MIRITSERLVLRSTLQEDAPVLRDELAQPSVATWWGPEPAGFPLADDPDAQRLTVLLGDEVAGLVQFYEEDDPDFRHAAIDIFLADAFQGRGLGTEALEALVGWLVAERGHHRVTIDPAADNAPAIRSYEKAGFRTVGVTRRSWRHHPSLEWRDALLMEWLADG